MKQGRHSGRRAEKNALIVLISFQLLTNWPSPLSSSSASENACILKEAFLLQRYILEAAGMVSRILGNLDSN